MAYAIGVASPLSINVETFGTGRVAPSRIQEVLERSEILDFRPAGIIRDLDLTRPEGWSYRQTSALGHFGREQFPWERTDKAYALKEAV